VPGDIFQNGSLLLVIHDALQVEPTFPGVYLNRFSRDRGQHLNCVKRNGSKIHISQLIRIGPLHPEPLLLGFDILCKL
jgi:hypothetical protein